MGVLDKIGPVGSLITALCCLGYPVVLSFFTAIGAGFILTDKFLLPLLALFLAASVWGSYGSYKRHGKRAVVIMSAAGTVLVFAGLWVHPVVVGVGIAGLVSSPLWSILIVRKSKAEKG